MDGTIPLKVESKLMEKDNEGITFIPLKTWKKQFVIMPVNLTLRSIGCYKAKTSKI